MPTLFYAGYGNSKYAKTIVDAGVVYGSLYKYQSLKTVYKSYYVPEIVNIPAQDIDDRTADWLLSFNSKNIDVIISDVSNEKTLYKAGIMAAWAHENLNGLVAAEPANPIIIDRVIEHVESETFDTIVYSPAKDREIRNLQKKGDILEGLIGFDTSYWLGKGYPHQHMQAAQVLGLDNIDYVDMTATQVMASFSLSWYHYKIEGAPNKWFASVAEQGMEWDEGRSGKQYWCLEQSIKNVRSAWDQVYAKAA